MTRKCAAKTCRNRFTPQGNRRKFCSLACSKRENQRRYAAANPEKVRQSQHTWTDRNRLRVRNYRREYQRKWRATNLTRERERARKLARKWRKENHDQFLTTQRKRRVAKRELLIEQRRLRDGSIPRSEYLKLASRETRVHIQNLEKLAQRISKGRPTTKASIFAEAHKLRQQNIRWSTIARQLVLDEYRINPKTAIKRLQEGERSFRRKLKVAAPH